MQIVKTSENWLLFDFSDQLIISLINIDAEGRILLPDSHVVLTETPGSTGHFDWLRNAKQKIIGLRYWPFDDPVHKNQVSKLRENVSNLHYVKITKAKYIEFFFNGMLKSCVCEDFSNDQDLADNGITFSKHGEYGMFFEVDLTGDEVDQLIT